MLNVLAKRDLFAIDRRGRDFAFSSPVIDGLSFHRKKFLDLGGGHPGVSWKVACEGIEEHCSKWVLMKSEWEAKPGLQGIAEVLPKRTPAARATMMVMSSAGAGYPST